MFFGATSFSATTFAGVGIQNVVVLATGKRVNIAIGNAEVDFGVNPQVAELTLPMVPLMWYLGMI